MHRWHTLVPSRSSRYTVKGTELSVSYRGPANRWALYEVRMLDSLGAQAILYRVRDAETVTDAEVRRGLRPRVVAEFPTLDGVEEFFRSLISS